MGQALPWIKGASTLLSAGGQAKEGSAAQSSKEFEAKTRTAAASRKAYMAGKEGDIIESRARAVMAAGGGSASDPGAIEQLAKIKSASEYNVLSALYEGETESDILKYEGKVKKKAGRTKALSTILSGGAKAYESFKPKAVGEY